MEERARYVIRYQPELQDYEDLLVLHYKVSKTADVRVSRISGVILLVVGVVLLFCAVMLFQLDHGVTFLSVVALVMGVFGVSMFFLRKRTAARRMMRNGEKFADRKITVDDDGIQIHTQVSEAVYRFDSVESVYLWRDSIVLYVDKVHLLHFPFRCFAEGNPENFSDYITEKTGVPLQAPSDQHKKERK